jgi:outer membrane lipoprotein SlyB
MRAPALAAVALLALNAGSAPAQAPSAACDNCGKVVSVQIVSTEESSWRPLGTISAGAAGDGMAQPGQTTTALSFSRGERPTVVSIGAAGGVAYAKRPQAYQRPRWDVEIRMDRGDTRTIRTDYDPLIDAGDRVRVYGTQLERIAP